ncbi:unnamed protein product [Closterium sp. Yama58-4]|nr:unnamed protein product [Closterium sp. Yama58-4]
MAWKSREADFHQKPFYGKTQKLAGGPRYQKRHDYERVPAAHSSHNFEAAVTSNSIEPARIASQNLGSFISNVTPRVKLQHINKESERFSHPPRHETSTGCAFYTLGDLWDSLEEWSVFGAGVPIQLANGTRATQYYVPSISGLQLYARSSSWQLPESRNSGPESDCSDVSFHDSSSDSSESSDRNDGRAGDGTAKTVDGCVMDSAVDGAWVSKIHLPQSHVREGLPSGLDAQNSGDECAAVSWDACQDCNGGRLLLEFFERAPPHVRLPLFSKVEELEGELPCLRHLRSIDLHPRSWMAIAWYPLYKIPAGPSVRDLGASFLTFHSLSSPGPSGSCVRCNDDYWISPMKLPHRRSARAVRARASGALPGDVDAIIARGREAGAFVEHSACVVPSATDGPLRGLTFAVKDMYDVRGGRGEVAVLVSRFSQRSSLPLYPFSALCCGCVRACVQVAGVPTGFGNPTWLATHDVPQTTAPVVHALLEAGATLVGKAAMDELAFSLAGENAHYGTPLNPKAPLRIPGGSSSGSAAAVAAGLVDFALGSDTAGSVRIPANHCGVWGIRSSHARLPLTGAQPLQPSMDTVGWFARDASVLQQVGSTLFHSPSLAPSSSPTSPSSTPSSSSTSSPSSLRPFTGWLVAEDAFELADKDAASPMLRVSSPCSPPIPQLMEAWQCHGQWITEHCPAFGPGVAQRFQAASAVEPQGEQVVQAREKRARFTSPVESLVAGGKLLMLPAAPSIAPLKAAPPADVDSFRVCTLALTVIGGAAGLPQITVPLTTLHGSPLGVGLVAPRGWDEELLALAVRLQTILGLSL